MAITTDTQETAANFSSDPANDYVRIGPFADTVDANLARARLLQEGIGARTDGENLNTALGPIYGRAYSGGVYVLVRSDEEAAAREIIRQVEALQSARRNAATPPCPHCAHHGAARVTGGLRWLGLALMVVAWATAAWVERAVVVLATVGLGFLFWPQMPTWKCRACERRFRALEPEAPADPE